jgi:hypothetical protein
MAGLGPAIHVLCIEVVDARHKAGHDSGEAARAIQIVIAGLDPRITQSSWHTSLRHQTAARVSALRFCFRRSCKLLLLKAWTTGWREAAAASGATCVGITGAGKRSLLRGRHTI